VEHFERIRPATKVAKENMATTADNGNTHAGSMLDVFSGVAAIALASYMREGATGAAVVHGLAGAGTGTGTGAGTTGAQGLASVGAGVGAGVGGGSYGVVVTVVGM